MGWAIIECPKCGARMELGKHISMQTKADSIRSMSDEELAEWIVAIIAQETIYSARKVPTPDYAIEMRQRWLDRLRQECE